MGETAFSELQARFRSLWPSVTLRSLGDVERTVVVVHSISFDVPDHLIPVFPAYEERFLCLVLSLLRAPRSRVIYVTSQPIHPRVLDYFFALVPELDTAEARSRFCAISLVDGRNEPLARKLLARPGALRRIREAIGDPELAFILPFCMTADELQLAVELGLPDLRLRPEPQPARHEEGKPKDLRRRRRSAPGGPRGGRGVAICPRRSGSFGVGALRQRARS